mgnify:CR=1 FL=1
MKITGRLPGVLMLLPLLQLPGITGAQEPPFTYNDDWSLVSAPPPPGPYQAVNIDPRVPGQDAIPPMTTDIEAEWWLILLGGILNLIVGILLLVNPAKTAIAFAWVLGLYWFVQGIFVLVAMFLDHSAWGWKLFMGIIGILAGIVYGAVALGVGSALAVTGATLLIVDIVKQKKSPSPDRYTTPLVTVSDDFVSLGLQGRF